ncbi:MAG TPA: UDP-2,3-diacylglucosamine diphosphatase [Burkholderiaceae bacterium]|jgi:UDP-2,3-diacylglucosamine hydrolase|nr:UDP-2,3-diacylglucosamine diphosphatase [Burkholderiaceae bacterium]
MIRVRRDQTALFVSDMHLSDSHPATVRAFLAALDEHGREADFVFLLGDLFDAWVGDDALDAPDGEACVRGFADALRALSARGATVCLMRGNRDFLLGSTFADAVGARLLPDPCVIELHGVPVVLAHGDALCTDDTDYQAFRQLARSPEWQAGFLSRALTDRLASARTMRQQSEDLKSTKQAELMDVNGQAVAQLLRDTATRVMIHGHTHRPAHHAQQGSGAQRWVLPDWDEQAGRAGLLLARDGTLFPVGRWPEPAPSPQPLSGDVAPPAPAAFRASDSD